MSLDTVWLVVWLLVEFGGPVGLPPLEDEFGGGPVSSDEFGGGPEAAPPTPTEVTARRGRRAVPVTTVGPLVLFLIVAFSTLT